MTNELIQAIHASPMRLVMAVTGGGSLAVSDLLAEPGASQTVLEASVPYGEVALCEFLLHKPEQFCSEKTARRMAVTALMRAMRFVQPIVEASQRPATAATNIIGIGCTCSLASNRPKRGEHRMHWAVQSVDQTWTGSVVLSKGTRSRVEEERLVADLLIATIAAFARRCDTIKHDQNASSTVDWLGLLQQTLQSRLSDGETLSLRTVRSPTCLQNLLFGNKMACCIRTNALPQSPCDQTELPSEMPAELPQFLFPGSFEPMHRGHRRMIEIVREKYGPQCRIALELAVQNADKPPIDYIDISDRLTLIAQTGNMVDMPVWLTRLPRFADKSDVFRGVTFVIGTDTLKRIAMPQYYHDVIGSADAAIDRLIENRCRFLCFARKNYEGEIETPKSLPLPKKLRQIVDFIPADVFCDDISSTQLRCGD